jgi:aspartate/methionine/tyrosine aminotransferase
MAISEEAEMLNRKIEEANNSVLDMLSERGKAIYFPKRGILSQSAEAKGKEIDATIGIALDDSGEPLALSTIAGRVSLPKKDVFGYAPSYGNIDLRNAWKEMLLQKNPGLAGKSFSLPVVSAALTHGLSICGYMFCDKGDKIIVPKPFWENYNLIFENQYNAEIETFPLFNNSIFNADGLEKKLNSEGIKKTVLLNFPNNPTGYTPKNEEIPNIISSIKGAADKGKKIVVLVDDAYFGLVYRQGVYKESIFSELAGLSENVLAVKLDGATKEDFAWGLRVGFITYGIKQGSEALYKYLEDKTAGAIRGSISNTPQISQSLLLKSFKDKGYKDEKLEKYRILKERHDKVSQILEHNTKYQEFFEPLPFNSGYFMCIKTTPDAEKVRQTLLSEHSTGVIVFEDIIRIAFSAVPSDKLERLFENVYEACRKADAAK